MRRTSNRPAADHRRRHLDRLARTNEVLRSVTMLRLSRPDDRGRPSDASLVDSAGARTMLLVPMIRDDALVGAITMYRTEVRPFTDRQINLVKSFAAQAVIAVENARLFDEVQRRTRDLKNSCSGRPRPLTR